MDALKFKTAGTRTPCKVGDDVEGGFFITRGTDQFYDAETTISISKADAFRLRDWLNAKYPAKPASGKPVEQMSFEYAHLSGERRTVSITREDVIEGMEDSLYEKLSDQICRCDPIGETNVVECNCQDYIEEFALVSGTPASSTSSDRYRAELYDEVWTMATRMGYGNVTDALTALANRLTNERAGHKPAAAIDASGDVITERDCVSAEVFATCCKVATPLFYAFARGVPVYQIRQHGTDEWKTVGPNSYDAAENCPDLARRVAYLPLSNVYS